MPLTHASGPLDRATRLPSLSTSRPETFRQALLIVAFVAQALLVLRSVHPAFEERHHVVSLRCEPNPAVLKALHAEGLTGEQLGAHSLEPPTGDPLRRAAPLFAPARRPVPVAVAGPVVDECGATGVLARLGSGLNHM